MTIHPPEPNGTIGKSPVQVTPGRQLLFQPVILVPTAAKQPVTRPQAGFLFTQFFQDFGLAGGAHEVRLGQRLGQSIQMRVRVNQTGNHSPPLKIAR